jgi:hypothetical protein
MFTMALKPEELLAIAPDAAKLVELLNKALKKDEDGKVRITPEEGKAIKALITKMALQLAKDAID